jgi:hypothetical protein
MANHPRRSWRRRWTLDLLARPAEARHDSGAVVLLPITGAPEFLDRAQTILTLTQQHGAAAAEQIAARLLREAGELFNTNTIT